MNAKADDVAMVVIIYDDVNHYTFDVVVDDQALCMSYRISNLNMCKLPRPLYGASRDPSL